MHYFKPKSDITLAAHQVFEGHSHGYFQTPLVDHTSGSVHTGLSLCQLNPDGEVAPHVHSFEEGFYLLEGAPEIGMKDEVYSLRPGDFGVAKVGWQHAWHNSGHKPARWLQMAAPQPKPIGKERDTFFAKNGKFRGGAKPLDLTNLNGTLFGHFDMGQVPAGADRSAAVAGSPGAGVFLKWLIDEKFGARHQRMVFIEYEPGANIQPHDHTFEESYFLLSGEVEGIMDGERYLAQPGDVLWTGVGCVHSFKNIGNGPVRWLETFAPQPPLEDVFRFMHEWHKRAAEIEG